MPPTAPPSARIQPAAARLLPFLRRHGITLAVTAVATAHAVLLGSVHIGLAFAAFIAAVLVAAWRDGIKGGLAVTAFALPVLAGLCLRQPEDGNEQLIRLGLFALVGALASYLGRECRRAVRAVDLLHDTVS
ncbi:MAG TPA: hypothetical protein VFA26_17080, partial [Gemmataceae bacterium]|nr:hypothetical protein [Gemmataceae bacterium]